MLHISDLHIKIPNGKVAFNDAITSMTVNWTMDGASRLEVDVVDKDFKMLKNDYFELDTVYEWGTRDFLLSTISVRQGDGDFAVISLELFESKCQQLKNNKNPGSFKATNGYQYAQNVAAKMNLTFVGERVKGDQQMIQVKAKNNRESVWQVLQRTAQENQYVCFIADNTLFFASPMYLLGRWGVDSKNYQPKGESVARKFSYVPLEWPTPEKEKRFSLMEMPKLQVAKDMPTSGSGSALVWRDNGYKLRAGMTCIVRGISPQFNKPYLITSVEYKVDEPEPVAIEFATVDKISNPDTRKLDEVEDDPPMIDVILVTEDD